jgi:hypothetical protein
MFLGRGKRSHLEMRTLGNASGFGTEQALVSAISELSTSYQQLSKWYEEGHFLLDDYARVHRQVAAVREAIFPNSKGVRSSLVCQ